MAAKKKRKSATPRKKASRKKASASAAPKRAKRKSVGKRALTDKQVAAAFSRAVRAGSAAMARKLASELKRRSPYGIYSAEGVSPNDLQAFEAMTKRKRK